MKELISLVLELSRELKTIQAYLEARAKTKADLLRESWLDGNQVMKVLKISRRTLLQMRNSGELSYSKVRNKLYYKLEDIELLLESNYTTTKIPENGNHKRKNT